jgi:hypothetical protein
MQALTSQVPPDYLHRIDQATGLIQSICARCFETVARAKRPAVLNLVESQHDCPAKQARAQAA